MKYDIAEFGNTTALREWLKRNDEVVPISIAYSTAGATLGNIILLYKKSIR